jgi:peptide/nickel transport system substrate-binding protein
MVEGSDKLDFSLPPARQPKLSGLVPGGHITLVRNPSYSPSTDSLRKGYVDRIEITITDDDPTAIANKIVAGAFDLDLSYQAPQPSLLDIAQRLRNGPQASQVHVGSRDFIRYVSMNLATPPFDDIAVRRAVNYVVNKAAVQETRGGPLAGAIADHVAFDSMENNLLVSYDPYPSPGNAGDISAARAEMAKSRYDTNHDGICDAPVCRNVLGLTIQGGPVGFASAARKIAKDLEAIGIHVHVVPQMPGKTFGELSDPTTKVPLGLAVGWGKDYLNASDFIDVLFTSASIGNSDYSLIGATPAQLRSWRYPVSSVPSIDDRIGQCRRISGDAQTSCWASLDQYIMEQVVPWVPLLFEAKVNVTSSRIVAYSFDQFANEPSLDRLALRPGS